MGFHRFWVNGFWVKNPNPTVNCTLAGPEEALFVIQKQLERDGIFAQKLSTGIAYHSADMLVVAAEYLELLSYLSSDVPTEATDISMVSSVTGEVVLPRLLAEPQYWVNNLVSPVRFSDAMQVFSDLPDSVFPSRRAVTDIIEVGPHPALRRPIHDSIQASSWGKGRVIPRYHSLLHRNKGQMRTFLGTIGQMFCLGYPVTLSTVDHLDDAATLLVDCPQYPFDQSLRYWNEPRLSRNSRLPKGQPNALLGTRFLDENPLRPSWRKILKPESMPWLREHIVNGLPLFPAAGVLVMSVEAAKQQLPPGVRARGLIIKNAQFVNPIIIDDKASPTEIVLYLRPGKDTNARQSLLYDIQVCAYYDHRWSESFTGQIQVDIYQDMSEVDVGKESRFESTRMSEDYHEARIASNKGVNRQRFYEFTGEAGLNYLKSFQLLHDILWDGHVGATATIRAALDTCPSTVNFLHPTVMDASFQLALVPISGGLSRDIDSLVPSRIEKVWISADGWNTKSANVSVATRAMTGRRSYTSNIRIMDHENQPLFVVDGILMTTVAEKRDTRMEISSKLLYGIDWKPQLSLLSPMQLRQVCRDEPAADDDPNHRKFFANIESVLIISIRRALRRISNEQLLSFPPHLERYVSATQRYLTKQFDSFDRCEDEFDHLLERCERERPDYKLVTTVARNLQALIESRLNPLETFFHDGLADRFYDSACQSIFKPDVRKFLELASHEKPSLRVLEVGAGTGSMTKQVLEIVQDLEARDGTSKFLDYTFTDISPLFFKAAREKFQTCESRMIYKKLNLESDPVQQGFEEATFDIILADSVFHATSDLARTLRNVRRLLKPKGYLMFIEINPLAHWMNIIWGLLPGWWLSQETWRLESPLATEQQWNDILHDTGFSGNDLVIRDSEVPSCHVWSLLITTAVEEGTAALTYPQPDHNTVLVVDPESAVQHSIAKRIIAQHGGSITHLAEACCMSWTDETTMVSLLEIETPFLANMSEREFYQLKQLMSKPHGILWVSSSQTDDPGFPQFNVMTGFFRTLQSESPWRTFVTLFIQACDNTKPDSSAAYISQVLRTAIYESNTPETEFIVRDGMITTGRLIREQRINEIMNNLVSPRLHEEPWGSGSPVKLEVGTPGILDTLRLVDDSEFYRSPLAHEEVEIELKTWPVSFRDLMIALGRLEGEDGLLGLECAGTVTRVGSACPNLEPGAPVILMTPGTIRTYPRAHQKAIIRIPGSLSFEDAVSVINPAMTVYHALKNLARLKKGEKVLIHSASGATGQMAVLIAQWIGAEVFATVGYNHKKDFLTRKLNVAEDHIFCSRDLSFAKGIMRMTGGQGVDVILNSLSGQALRATWECIASYGRFIEIGKTDILTNASLPMGQFRGNVSFFALDIQHISQTDLDLTQALLKSVMDMLTKGIIKPPLPTRVFPAQKIEEAFREVQSGKHTGRILLTINDHPVTKFIRDVPTWKLDSNASYVIAGGFGGLGRSIIKWLVTKGAKHLIVLSRTGTSSSAAAVELATKLRTQGIRVAAPNCDLSSPTIVRRVLDECCRTMPTVKGFINSANNLQDSIFDNMTYEQWDRTLRTKISSSWTIHELLPRDLDFFVLLSSISGIHGIPSQSNYAAACTYQDALARYRVAHGQKAISLDIGWMRSVGIISEKDRYLQTFRTMAHINPIEECELLALLDIYCDPAFQAHNESKGQLVIGAMTAADAISNGKKPTPDLLRPLFSGFSRPSPGSENTLLEATLEDQTVQFQHAKSPADRLQIVTQALIGKAARLLNVGPEDIKDDKCLSDYGVDSLIAVELRNWISYDFRASVTTFEILGGKAIASLAASIAETSQLVADVQSSEDSIT